jgi:Flp pilus assembly protein protease CpaA
VVNEDARGEALEQGLDAETRSASMSSSSARGSTTATVAAGAEDLAEDMVFAWTLPGWVCGTDGGGDPKVVADVVAIVFGSDTAVVEAGVIVDVVGAEARVVDVTS